MDAAPLPTAPPESSRPDALRRLWSAVTVRVAWELLLQGVQPRGAALRHAREHALRCLPAGVGLAEAEAVATQAARDWVARLGGRYEPWVTDPDLSILPDPRWRLLVGSLPEPVHDMVFRLHYADGLSLEDVSMRTGVDLALLRAGREAVLEMARSVLLDDGVPVQDWDAARVDRYVRRIATAAGDVCPGPGGLATELGRQHAEECPRCSRALRLLREGVLSPSDLFAPDEASPLLPAPAPMLLVHLHPDGRRHRAALLAALGPERVILNREVFAVEVRDAAALRAALVELAEEGTPPASQLRLVTRPVRGRVGGGAITGLDVLTALQELHALEWGGARGWEALPEPLPPPPSAARWWMTALVAGLVAVAVGLWVLLPPRDAADVPLTVEPAAGGVRFDTDDEAWVDVVAIRGGTPSLLAHSEEPLTKAAWATGDGRYELPVEADEVLVVARSTRLDEMDLVIAAQAGGTDGATLAERLRERFPGAAVAVTHPAAR